MRRTSYENRAAMYVRASTEHQIYSTGHQEATLREYAAEHNLEIIATYCDDGRSGLTLEGRHGLQQLLKDIHNQSADFSIVLVLDVTRWGRFQDADEAAYYEFSCRRAGVAVAYCAEPFLNDASGYGSIFKQMKRAMAFEYSRELSTKVFRAQCRLTAEGFKQGGSAGYGLRRLSVTAEGVPREVLAKGERKRMQTDHVTYTAGPANEVAVVHQIYAWYIDDKLGDTEIADRLNAAKVAPEFDMPWSTHHVKMILSNPKYAGTMVFNRSSQRLKTKRRRNDQHKWIKVEDAFPAIVSKERFAAAVAERNKRNRQWTDDEMLDGLRDMLIEHGKVTAELIEASALPSVKSFVFRFDSMIAAMEAAGVSGPSVSRATIVRFRSQCITRDMLIELERCARRAQAQVEQLTRRTYMLNGVTARLLCTRCRYERSHPCWKVTLRHDPPVDFVIWARMDEANERTARYYLLPVADFPEHQFIWPSTLTLKKYECYAHDSMASIFGQDRIAELDGTAVQGSDSATYQRS